MDSATICKKSLKKFRGLKLYMEMPEKINDIDLEWLLKLRIAIARCGEMDVAKWWNTDKQLASPGAAVLRRGFPRSYRFAQSRSVIAVASHRCTQLLALPSYLTLWRLTNEVEESFDIQWESCLDSADKSHSFFDSVEKIKTFNLIPALQELNLVTKADVETFDKIKKSSEASSLEIPGIFSGERSVIALLALGFSRGNVANLVVPYMKGTNA